VGFFKKSEPPRPPATGLASPVTVELGDKDRVRRMLGEFEAAVGDDASVRWFARELNKAGGWRSTVDTVTAVGNWGTEVIHRPWRWVAEVGRALLQEGDALSAARVSVMAEFWHSQIAPRQVTADQFDGEIGGPPSEVLGELCRLGLQAMSTLPPDVTVVDNPRRQETVTVEAALLLCCLRIVRLGPAITDPDLVALAYQTLEATGVSSSRADEAAAGLAP
jgi:hypothetical protein